MDISDKIREKQNEIQTIAAEEKLLRGRIAELKQLLTEKETREKRISPGPGCRAHPPCRGKQLLSSEIADEILARPVDTRARQRTYWILYFFCSSGLRARSSTTPFWILATK